MLDKIKKSIKKKRLQIKVISNVFSLKYFYKLLLILIIIEFLIMIMLHYVNLDTKLLEPLIDSTLLALLSFPLLMTYIIEPFSNEINIKISQELDKKTAELKELNNSLEQKVFQKTNEITQRSEELQAIWNIEKNIMIFTDGNDITDANHSFFNFFSKYKTLEEFKKEHKCVCDFFEKVDDNEYINKDIDNVHLIEYILQHPDKHFKVAMQRENSLHFFSIHAQRVSSTEIEKFIVTFNDITELENYQNHLEREVEKKTNALMEKDKIMMAQSRQAAMGDMISMIAHQWRQPITAIGMGAQNMQLDIELEEIDPARFDTKLTKIVEQTDFLSKTIDDFRNFLKPNKKPSTCMLSEIAENALTIIGKSLENNNVTLEKSYGNDIKITTFINEVIQVLINILNNAKDIIKIKNIDDGIICLNISHDDERAKFEICDNAGGIPDDILPRIFEPYFSTKEESGGTGLGLYMSQMIVEKHLCGTIAAYNTDKGACFSVSVPLKCNKEV